MEMVFRWFGEDNDHIPLSHIKQIPGVKGIVWALHHIPAGEKWTLHEIEKVKKSVESSGFNIDVVESVNVHEDIKLGRSTRDYYIENYKQTMKNLAEAGVKVICYNFMPVFDWIRTELFKELEDGSTALFYEKAKVEGIEPDELAQQILKEKSFTLPGWEPERLAKLSELFDAYQEVTEEMIWSHLKYFLDEIIPLAEQLDIRMAIHPDDPPWSVFGLPRIITNERNISRFLNLVDSPNNGLTLCSGSLGANGENDIPSMIHKFGPRIHFAHIRNLKRYDNGDFVETSHRTEDGSLDIYEIVKAYRKQGFTGYVRPDHGRHIWDETCRPGYGLYDRALGIMYIQGIWDSLVRMEKESQYAAIK
ncbi:mannonate dehydratase [Halobacillus sp. B23F22_1]|uniref:mannonate dehydratase n=1 Tax=Halobacillus sp. B23F22_1 TaxID=3459514 RepID=UPI00373F9BB8